MTYGSGCKCHGVTFCPDLICVGMEDDQPIFARKDSPEGIAQLELEATIALKKRPVAWRCKDYGDGWIIYQDEAEAFAYHEKTNCLMQGLYVRDGT